MHTHFRSWTTFVATGLNVVLFLTFWRLVWLHVGNRSSSPTLRSLARAALFQA